MWFAYLLLFVGTFILQLGFDIPAVVILLVEFISFVVTVFLTIGFTRLLLDLSRSETTEFTRIFSQGHILLSALGATVIYAIMVTVGMVFLIIPGIFLFVKFFLYQITLVDRGVGALESLKIAGSLVRGNWWNLFGLIIITAFINMAGALLLLIGLLVTVPLTLLSYVCAYIFLSSEADRKEGAEEYAEDTSHETARATA